MRKNNFLPIKVGLIRGVWLILHLLTLRPIVVNTRYVRSVSPKHEHKFLKNFELMVDRLSLPQNRDLLEHIQRLNNGQDENLENELVSRADHTGRSSLKEASVSPLVYRRMLQRFESGRSGARSSHHSTDHGLAYLNKIMGGVIDSTEAPQESATEWNHEVSMKNKDLMQDPHILDYIASYPGAGHTMLNSIDEGANLSITLLPMHNKGYFPYGNTLLNEGGRGVNGALLHVASDKKDSSLKNILNSIGSLDFEIDLKKFLGANKKPATS